MSDRDYVPLGFSREEGGGSSLSVVNHETECPECDDGILTPPSSFGGGWGSPDSPASVYCSECSTKFVLALVPE